MVFENCSFDKIASGHTALVCGTGYTGEDGVEIL